MAMEFTEQSQLRSLPSFSLNREMRPRDSDLNDILRGIETSVPESLGPHIELKMDLSETPLNVEVDVAGVENAVMKLVRNAAEAMPEGGVLTVSTNRIGFDYGVLENMAAGILGQCAVICVQDNGTGMDERTRDRIFEPFFTTKGETSRGLGLPIAYHIIRTHRGSMNVESMPGFGTKVNVYLALAEKQPKEMEPIPLPTALTAESTSRSNEYQNRSM